MLNSELSHRVVTEMLYQGLLLIYRDYKRYRETGLLTRLLGSGSNRVTSERDDRFIVTTTLRHRCLNYFQLQQQPYCSYWGSCKLPNN